MAIQRPIIPESTGVLAPVTPYSLGDMLTPQQLDQLILQNLQQSQRLNNQLPGTGEFTIALPGGSAVAPVIPGQPNVFANHENARAYGESLKEVYPGYGTTVPPVVPKTR